MPFILGGTTIRRPNTISEVNNTQTAENRTLSGNVSRDIFGSNKRIWQFGYKNVNPTDYATILAIYQSYLSLKTAKSFQITESNYTVAATTVHIDLQSRGFSIQGSSYLSDFTLVLKEA